MNPLSPLVAFLGLKAQSGYRPRLEPRKADWLSGFLTISVRPRLDPAKGLVDLADQLALAVPRAKLESTISLARCPVGEIGMALSLELEMGYGFPRFAQDIVLPVQQLLLELLELPIIHERLVLRGTVLEFLQLYRRMHRRLAITPGSIAPRFDSRL